MPFSYSLWAQASLKLSRQKVLSSAKRLQGSASHSLGTSLEMIWGMIFKLFHRGTRFLGWAAGTAQRKTSGSGLLALDSLPPPPYPQAALFLFGSCIRSCIRVHLVLNIKQKWCFRNVWKPLQQITFSLRRSYLALPRAVWRLMYLFPFKDPCFLF